MNSLCSTVSFLVRFMVVTTIGVLCCACRENPTSPTVLIQPPAGSGAVPVQVFGRVVDFSTNIGVAAASIEFYVTGLPTIASSVITDSAGRYSVWLSRGVRYNPRINGPDVDSNRGVIIPVAKLNEADYLVNGGTCIVFYGTVRDVLTGEPVADAQVAFGTPPTRTDTDGNYRIDLGCPTIDRPWQRTGTTFLNVSHARYITVSPYGTRAEFLPAARTQRIDVALEPRSP